VAAIEGAAAHILGPVAPSPSAAGKVLPHPASLRPTR
jgi:hypothetical protein